MPNTLCLLLLAVPYASALSFSSVFSDGVVLQRRTTENPGKMAAVYGTCDAADCSVTITIVSALDKLQHVETVKAVMATATNDWKAFLKPKEAGGSFNVIATASNGATATLRDVTFGDVWFCSGQSNMELNMHYTHHRNDTYEAVGRDEYNNIRLFHLDHSPAPYLQPQWQLGASSVFNNWTIANKDIVVNGGAGDQCPGRKCTVIDNFSAACWYFAQSLTDRMKKAGEVVPLGMIESAYGGTTIEQWVSVEAQLKCSNVTCHANASLPYSAATAEACTQDEEMGNGGLYNGMVAPFVNMTVSGFLWYQANPDPDPDP